MDIVLVLIKQLTVMFFYMVIGYVLYKKKFITEKGSRELGTLLLYVLLPCVIFDAFLTEAAPGMLRGMGISFLFSTLSIALAQAVSYAFFGKRHRIEAFAASYSNAGYMGVPLIRMVLGSSAVFYASAFVAMTNVYQWTYGIYMMTGDKRSIQPKKILTNPSMIAVAAGILVFLFRIRLPGLATQAIGSLASMNGPIAMIILGVYLAQIDLRSMFTDRLAYLCSAVRLIIAPVLCVLLFLLIPKEMNECRICLSVIASAPVAVAAALFAQQNDLSYTEACKSVCMTTLLSLVTMPLILVFANLVFSL